MDLGKAAVEARRKQVDARITALEQDILDLKTERNSLSPTGLLPPEVLEQIFVVYRDFCPQPSLDTSFNCKGTVLWNVLAEVCRHWRSIALECPRLWSDIAFHRLGWAKLMLARSKHAPLTVDLLSWMNPKIQACAEEALSQGHRLKVVRIYTNRDWAKKKIQELVSPAPILERLQIENRSEEDLVDDHGTDPTVDLSLPDNFLGNEAPRLRHLSLVGWRFKSLETPLLAGLTNLRLCSRGDPEALLKLDHIVEALEKIPRLEELDLEDILGDQTLTSKSRSTPLLCLKILRLKASLKAASAFFTQILVPRSASIVLRCFAGSLASEDSAFSKLGDALCQSWISQPGSISRPGNDCRSHPGLSPSFESLALERYSYLTLETRICCHFQTIDFTSRDWRELTVSLQLEISGLRGNFLEKLLPALPLGRLHALYLGCEVTSAELQCVSRLPGLWSVYLRPPSVHHFMQYLTSDCMEQSGAVDEVGGALCFPALTFLSLEDVDFVGYSRIKLEDLLDMLIIRYEVGGEVETLRMRGIGYLSAHQLGRLQEVCVDVDWEGHLSSFAPDEDFDSYDDYRDYDDYDSDYHGYDYTPEW